MKEDEYNNQSEVEGYFYTLSALAYCLAVGSFYLFIRLVIQTERSRLITRKFFFALIFLAMSFRGTLFVLEPSAVLMQEAHPLPQQLYLIWNFVCVCVFVYAYFILLVACIDFYFLLSGAPQTQVFSMSLTTLAQIVFACILVAINVYVVVDALVFKVTVYKLNDLGQTCAIVVTAFVLGIAVGFFVFGILLVRLLLLTNKRGKTVKMGVISFVIAVAFLLKAIFMIVDVATHQSGSDEYHYDMPLVTVFLFYLLFEIALTFLLLLLMSTIPQEFASQSRVSHFNPIIQESSKSMRIVTIPPSNDRTPLLLSPENSFLLSSSDSDDDPFEDKFRLISGSYDDGGGALLEVRLAEHR